MHERPWGGKGRLEKLLCVVLLVLFHPDDAEIVSAIGTSLAGADGRLERLFRTVRQAVAVKRPTERGQRLDAIRIELLIVGGDVEPLRLFPRLVLIDEDQGKLVRR